MTMPDIAPSNPDPDYRGNPESRAIRRNLRLAAAVCAIGIFVLTLLSLIDESPIETRTLEPHTRQSDQLLGGVAIGVDPNTATWAELALLPGLGESVAKRIIAYRNERQANGRWPIFRRPEDLLPVKGIGEKTLNRMRHLLRFEATDGSD
jgi:competence protein ComEA